RLPPFVTAVGVFVDQPAEYVNGVAALVRLGAIQLHGDETVEYAASLSRPTIKTIGAGAAADAIDEWPSQVTMLVDAHDQARRGGTGRTVDWEAASTIARRRRTL